MSTRDPIAEIKAKLDVERTRLLASFARVSPEDMLRAPEGYWSIKDILVHVAMAESVNVRFARMMVEKPEPEQLVEFARDYPEWKGEFDLNRFNAQMAERGRSASLQEAIAAVNSTRAETLAWLDSLRPEQLDRTGKHAVWGEQTVRGMFRILVIHDRFHRADIEKLKGSG